jgi:hypothetical protein
MRAAFENHMRTREPDATLRAVRRSGATLRATTNTRHTLRPIPRLVLMRVNGQRKFSFAKTNV